jgi:transposase InsO family protein
MNIHKNASMTPKGRAHLVREIDRIGLKPAAAAAGLSPRTARKWRHRHAVESAVGLVDRSSRPLHCPRRSDASKIERAVALRRTQRLTYECIAERVGLSRSTVARACKAAGVARLPALQDTVPVRRYERQSAGELLHLDTKKLDRFDKPGHRVTGDRTQNTPRAGWQALHVAIDDHSRVGFSLMLADETAKSACAFVLAAPRYYKALGVKIERVMTDNGSACKSRRFAKLLRRLGIKHIRTRPYTPRTNGKAERFIQTLLREWAYAFI